MATYRPGIDQSQHVKSVSYIISSIILLLQILISFIKGSFPQKILSKEHG